jgi:tetratricopeptide (TPR) repeat protein
LQEGVAAAQAGDAERARACLLRVVEATPDGQRNVQAWYWLSPVVRSPHEREICLENVLALDPGRTAEEELIADAAVEPLHCPYCDALTQVADRQCSACSRDLYVRERKSAVAFSPGHPEYRLALATAYINLGQPERAVEHLDKAQEIEPDNRQALDLLASLKLDQ